MKTGKNRPLDEDELDFVNELKSREQSRDTKQAAEEQEQLDAFRQVWPDPEFSHREPETESKLTSPASTNSATCWTQSLATIRCTSAGRQPRCISSCDANNTLGLNQQGKQSGQTGLSL